MVELPPAPQLRVRLDEDARQTATRWATQLNEWTAAMNDAVVAMVVAALEADAATNAGREFTARLEHAAERVYAKDWPPPPAP